MIDRAARNEAISAFEAYLDDQITAFEFDNRLQEVESEDSTVRQVIHAAWFHYDDCTDHMVRLSKSEWDYFQRLLLILRSDVELSMSSSRRWSVDHLIASVACATFVGIAFAVGWGWHLILWAVPFGFVSILISMYRRRREADLAPRVIACTPFNSLTEIRWLRRQLPSFKKRMYRAEIRGRKIRTKTEEACNWVLAYCYWFAFAPLVLLCQSFPSTVDHTFKLTKP